MKPTKVQNCNVHVQVDNNGVHLVVTTSDGRSAMFTPPASPVVHAWAEEMMQRALQLELPLG